MSGHNEEVLVATEAVDGSTLGKLLLEANLDARSLLSGGEDDESTETAGGVC